MKDQLIHNPKGLLHIKVIDKFGKLIYSNTSSNLIVSTGYSSAIRAIAGDSSSVISKIGIGENNNPPLESDSSLQNAQYVNITSVEYPAQNTARFNFTIPNSVGNGMRITEFGLFTTGGVLFSRKVRETIEKSEAISIVGYWEIHV